MRSAEPRRAELELRQRSLIAALVAGVDPPPDLDAERIRVQAAALIRKRGRIVGRTHAELAAALGSEFGPVFHHYATSRPGPRPGCATEDAREFARYLLRSVPARSREVLRAARRVAGPWPRRWPRLGPDGLTAPCSAPDGSTTSRPRPLARPGTGARNARVPTSSTAARSSPSTDATTRRRRGDDRPGHDGRLHGRPHHGGRRRRSRRQSVGAIPLSGDPRVYSPPH